MTPLLFVVIAVAGGLGAVARFVVDEAVRARMASRSRLPLGTIVVNLTGSLAMGLLVGVAAGAAASGEWVLVLGAGFLGGYTTFSTASIDTVRLVQQRAWRDAVVNGLGVLVATTVLAGVGMMLGVMFGTAVAAG